MIRKDTYQIGDKVWFKNPETFMVEKYGTGPHKIIEIIEIKENFRGVGHTQLVKISGHPDNEVSGYWFHPLR